MKQKFILEHIDPCWFAVAFKAAWLLILEALTLYFFGNSYETHSIEFWVSCSTCDRPAATDAKQKSLNCIPVNEKLCELNSFFDSFGKHTNR